VFPWKHEQKTALLIGTSAMRNAATSEEDEALRKEFISKAKAGLLDCTEVVVGSMLLFEEDLECSRRKLLSILLRVPQAQRLPVYNWMQASRLEEGVLMSHGPAIAQLQTPLFPAPLHHLNERLWGTLHGGGTQELYREEQGLWGGAPNARPRRTVRRLRTNRDGHAGPRRCNAADAAANPAPQPATTASGQETCTAPTATTSTTPRL
jgi:hypothetical protein